ncbi:DUF742 domain-containing protein [Actinacidiphila acididurans]|uniref:DUF742 domain-containing protein n=1 Tax=Actinacidiphila acididurans TaxID=2784346 RepID=A0ABS2TRA5_9ACTN|nr:DUF742 domain-containing protein [Actinacidiphila acididurans]MBM9505863.1 DUF742 domain-containing protein [Actinacidiphila acididurans]
MTRRPVDSGVPDRLYTVTGGRSRTQDTTFDLVTIVVGEAEPALGMQSEHIRILRLCGRHPTSLVELSSHLGLPVGVVKILLADLLAAGRISARHPRSAAPGAELLPPAETLKKVLRALQNL